MMTEHDRLHGRLEALLKIDRPLAMLTELVLVALAHLPTDSSDLDQRASRLAQLQ
jgi:hypothetical protein